MQRRMSWTTKPAKALTLPTLEQADMYARAFLARKINRGNPFPYRLQWASSQGGFVIYNEDGTRMITDR